MNSGRRSAVRVRSGDGHPPWPDITTKKKRRRAPPKMCEGCGLKQPGFGLLLDGKKRWCGRCAQAEGAVLLQKRNVCEGCDCVKTANFGLRSEGKRRWCGACGKAKGVVLVGSQKMCESCGLRHANFGRPAEGKRRWCGACAKGVSATINLSHVRRFRPVSSAFQPTPKIYLLQANIMLGVLLKCATRNALMNIFMLIMSVLRLQCNFVP